MMTLLYLVVMFTFVPRNCVDGFKVIGRVTVIIFNNIFLTNLSTCQGLGYKPSAATYNPIGIPNAWGSWDELCIKKASSFPMCWSSKGKPFNRMLVDLCFSQTPTLPTLAQKPPMFQSLSDTIALRNASGKKTRELTVKAVMSVIPLNKKHSRETHNWQHAFLTILSEKNNNKTPEFRMAKQHLGLILEALVLGHSNPWARSHLSLALLQIHRSHDSDLLNTTNKHFKHLLAKLRRIKVFRHDFSITRHISALNPRFKTRVRWSCSVGRCS